MRALLAWFWRTPGEGAPAWRSALSGAARLLAVLARDLAQGQLTLRATSLVYTTLLSLVPLLALSFSVLNAFGVQNQVAPVLMAFLSPLGEQSALITDRVIEFIGKLNVRVLGSIGLGLLLYTVVSLMKQIEESVNFIWHVTRLRGLARRTSGYLSVLLVGPVLVFALVGASRALTKTAVQHGLMATPPAALAQLLGHALPVAGVIAIFTFAYYFVPNTHVRFRAALAGGVVAGGLWQAAAWGFAAFAAGSTQYAAIYSSLAILILFLIWVYINWLILLLGASLSFYWQHPEYLVALPGEPRLSNRMRERVALIVLSLIAKAYYDGAPPLTFAAIVRRLGVPMHAVDIVLAAMQEAGLLVQAQGPVRSYVPARELSRITVREVLETVRAAGEDRFLSPDAVPAAPQIEALLREIDAARGERLGELTLRELIEPPAVEPAGEQVESV
jgi:membrane protein